MEVILRQDVEKLGLRGEVVNVARGYARNFLLPRNLAEVATPSKVAELEKREAQRARSEAQSVDQAREIAQKLQQATLRFDVKAGENGTLFGSVTPTQIADALWSQEKVRVDRRKIGVDSIKRIGRYEVPIELFTDVTVEVQTLVVPEGGELPSEEELAAMEAAENPPEETPAEPEGALELEAAIAAAEQPETPESDEPAEAEADDETPADAEPEPEPDTEEPA